MVYRLQKRVDVWTKITPVLLGHGRCCTFLFLMNTQTAIVCKDCGIQLFTHYFQFFGPWFSVLLRVCFVCMKLIMQKQKSDEIIIIYTFYIIKRYQKEMVG
jgi:hypothetical protein